MEAQGSVPDEQVRRRLSGETLVWRLRERRYGRAAGDRSREAAFRLRTCQRPAAQRRAGEHGRLFRHAKARRQNSRHEPRARRPSHPWPSGEFLRQILPGLAVRRQRRDGADRLRRSAETSRGGSPGHDHRRRVSLSAHHRFPAHAPNRRFRRRAFVHRHGAHRRARRRRPASQPDSARALRHHHDAQESSRTARRHRHVPGTIRQTDRRHHVPGRPGRPAHARHRRQGCLLSRSAPAAVPRLPAAGRRECQGARRRPGQARLPHRLRRHRQPPHARRSSAEGHQRKAGAGSPRSRRHHREQERHPLRHLSRSSSPAASASARPPSPPAA